MSYEDRFFTTKRKVVKQKARNAQCFILEKISERACNTSVFHAFFPRHLTPHQPNQMTDNLQIILASSLVIILIAMALMIADEIRCLKQNLDNKRKLIQTLIATETKKQKTMQTELDNLIAQTKGKFFSITFVKKDGSVRIINGKDKYQRLLKGGEYKGATAGFVPFVNRNTETWASAHKDAIVTFRCGSLVKEVSA
jgi:hypothetical protein